MAISHTRNQQSGQQGFSKQDNKNPIVTNPPVVSSTNQVVTDTNLKIETNISEAESTKKEEWISLDLDLSSITDAKPEKISNEDLPTKPEPANLDISLDLWDSPAKEPEQNKQVDFSSISVPEELKEQKVAEPVPNVEEHKIEKSVVSEEKEITPSKEQKITESIPKIEEHKIEEDKPENSTSESASEEKLSLDLPTDRSEKKDGEWLEKEDAETPVETTELASKDNIFTSDTLDLQAISMQKIQQTENNDNTVLEQNKTEVVSNQKPSTNSWRNTGGMMNLDDLGWLGINPTPTTTIIQTPNPVPIQVAPVSQQIQAPAVTNNGMMLDLDAITSPIPAVTSQQIPTPVWPEILAPTPPDLSNVNQEINASYGAITKSPEKKKWLHGDVSKTRKLVSVVVLIVLMIGWWFYIFKTMFPDKYQAIMAKKSTDLESQITVNDNTQTSITENTNPVPQPEPQWQQVPSMKPESTQVISQEVNTGQIEIEEKESSVVAVADLSWSENEHASADNGDKDEFDPFAEVEKMLEEPDPNQDKIDKLNSFLDVWKEYNDLGKKTEDTSIIKYSKVLTQKIPTDLAILTGGWEIDLAKIDQHIKLFENYIKKLEAIAPLE